MILQTEEHEGEFDRVSRVGVGGQTSGLVTPAGRQLRLAGLPQPLRHLVVDGGHLLTPGELVPTLAGGGGDAVSRLRGLAGRQPRQETSRQTGQGHIQRRRTP